MPTIDPSETALMRAMQEERYLPLRNIFVELYGLWKKSNPKEIDRDLALLLGVSVQAVSQWKTGSDPSKRPSWAALLLLCRMYRRKIVVTPAGVQLKRLR